MNILNSLFDWVLGAGLRASLLVLAVLAAQWLAKNRLPSRWRYALWLPVLVALLVPALPLLPSGMNWPAGGVNAEVLQKAAPSALANTVRTAVVLPESVERAEIPGMRPRIVETTSAAGVPVRPAKPVDWRAWLVIAWLIGTAGASLFVLASFALTTRRIRRTVCPVETDLLARIAHAASVVGLRRTPRVLKSPAVASPAVCGLWRPTLLLNEDFPQDLSAEEADMVLRHELTHIRRGDLAINALLCALLALHWFNPLLWLSFFRVRADREAACDAQVLDGEPAPRRAAYGHTLLKMETAFPPTGLCLGFVGILQRGGTLRGRIHSIISQPQLNGTMKVTIALSIFVLTIAGIAKAAENNGEAKPESVKEKKVSPADADTTAIAAANLGEAKKVTAAEFKEEYEWVGKAQDMHEVSYLGQQNGRAFIRKRSMLHASSFLPGKGGWSERIIYVQLQDLDAEFRALVEKATAKQESKATLALKAEGAAAKPERNSTGASTHAEAEGDAQKTSSEAKANTLALLKDGEYTLKVTHSTDDPHVQFPSSPIPDADYKPLDGALTLQLRFSAEGKKVSIGGGRGGAGPLEKQTANEWIYDLNKGLIAGGQLRLKQTAEGIIGTYTQFGSGLPVLESVRGVVTPATATGAGAAPAKEGARRVQPQPVDLEKIRDKVSVKFGEDTVAKLRRNGDRLLPRAPGEKGDANDVAVKITIKETKDTPFPVQGDPTRSYLSMSNGSDKWLRFRALARLKGSKEYYEVESPLEPVRPGEMSLVRCWESGTLVQEVILFEFKLTEEPSEKTDPIPTTPDAAANGGEAKTNPDRKTTHTVDGTQAERVAAITRQLSKAGKLPGPLLDAHFVEEQTGDGILGPSDFTAFYALTVTPADLAAWRTALSESKATWNHFANDSDIKRAAPKKAQTWWVSGADLSRLEFYSPKSLTGRSNGWVGIASDGRIFIYAFTM